MMSTMRRSTRGFTIAYVLGTCNLTGQAGGGKVRKASAVGVLTTDTPA